MCKLFISFFISVTYFPGTTASMILKFGTTAGYDHLYRVREYQSPTDYHSETDISKIPTVRFLKFFKRWV